MQPYIGMLIMAGNKTYSQQSGQWHIQNILHQNHNDTNIKITMPQKSKSQSGKVHMQYVAFEAHQPPLKVQMLMKNQWCWWMCSHQQLQWNKHVKKKHEIVKK